MSFILDAIRRAESERQIESAPGGAVPDLHSRVLSPPPAPAGPAREAPAAPSSRLPAWFVRLAGAAAVALLVVAAAALLRQPPAVVAAKAQPPADVVAAAERPPPVTSTTAMADAVPPVAPAARPTTLLLPAAASAAPPAATRPGTGVVLPSDPVAEASPVASAPGEPGSPLATPWVNLTPELKAQFPPLAIGGSIWSDDPPRRFVLIAGQVVREGETAVGGVVVERIGQRTLIVRWRGERIELGLP
jgi:general secretion pathway protein B